MKSKEEKIAKRGYTIGGKGEEKEDEEEEGITTWIQVLIGRMIKRIIDVLRV